MVQTSPKAGAIIPRAGSFVLVDIAFIDTGGAQRIALQVGVLPIIGG
jgi:hypothetical protein